MTGMVLITGAAQRVGLHCALGLQQAGYQVIATYRQPKAGVEQLRQAGAICLPLDIQPDTDLALQVSELADTVSALCQQHQLPLRALIHNASSWAGESGSGENLLDQLRADAAVFDDMFRIHTKLPYLLSRALAPLLADDHIDYVKAYYERPLAFPDALHSNGGGRVSARIASTMSGVALA